MLRLGIWPALVLGGSVIFQVDEEAPPPLPYNRDIDGYYIVRKTHSVYDPRYNQHTTAGSTTTTGTGTESSTSTTLSGSTVSTISGSTSSPGSDSTDITASHAGELKYNFDNEKKLKDQRAEELPQKGEVSPDEDVLIDIVGDAPLNPAYRDRSNFTKFVDRRFDFTENGWQVHIELRSRSKRCQSFDCPDDELHSVRRIQKCIESRAPGCVLEFSAELDLQTPQHMCCFDSTPQIKKESLPENPLYFVSNYTYILPTPELVLDFGYRENVATFARIGRPYKTGLWTTNFQSGGFGLSRMKGGCSDYRYLDIDKLAATVGTPGACDNKESLEYVECHGRPNLARDQMQYNSTGTEQLVFVANMNLINCITASWQYPLLAAKIATGFNIYPTSQGLVRLNKQLSSRALDYGYEEHPDIDATF